MDWLVMLVMLSATSAVLPLRCACNTQHCRATGSRGCATHYKCYVQYLEKSDGSDPVTTGCISGNTPLLCENRLPAVTHSKWPYLVCCDDGDLCNAGMAIPSTPPWTPLTGNASTPSAAPTGPWLRRVHSAAPEPGAGAALTGALRSVLRSVLHQPVVLAVLLVGVVLFAGIVSFGFLVLKKQSLLLQQAASERCTKNASERCTKTASCCDAPDAALEVSVV